MSFSLPSSCYVIAEIGGNFLHVDDGCALINAAADAGVNAVKLQTYRADTIAAKDAMFDMENTGKLSQWEFFKKYELSEEAHVQLFALAKDRGLDVFSTPSHPQDVDLLERCNVACYKIGADDASNLPFLRYVARTGKPVILSTGMCLLSEVQRAVDAILTTGNEQIVLLHTVSGYPTHPDDVNLRAMQTLQKAFPQFPVGFSDHSLDIWASLAAATLGARVVERHFTLDKNAEGPDHLLSSEPDEMKALVTQIRLMERMLGSAVKRPYGPEVLNRVNNRKSLVVTKAMKAGDVFTEDTLWLKRPGSGLPPEQWDVVIGKVAARDLQEDTILSWGDIK